MRIAIAGAGAFGSALAIALAQGGRAITLWARDPGAVTQMQADRQVPRLPVVRLPDTVTVTHDRADVTGADVILLAIPAQSLPDFLTGLDDPLSGKVLVACCKGIDLNRMTGPASTIGQLLPDVTAAVLTGPSFAGDIARGLPTALTLACRDARTGAAIQTELSTPNLRLYRTDDVIGAELGGALKNVMAIAAGVAIGAGLGDSARAALITRGFPEMQRLALALGGQATTLAGLSGLGDLVLTCTSDQSRNYRFGLALGQGADFDPSMTVEGVATARAVRALARKRGIDMPISATVADLIDGKTTIATALDSLLSRPLKEE